MGDWFWIISPIGAICWMIGGAGHKWVRRYLWPLAFLILIGRFPLWKPILATFLMIGALSLGYGENHPIWRRILTGLALSMPYFVFQCWWAGSISIIFLSSYLLSRKLNWWTWKWTEGLTGLAQGFFIGKLYF